MYKAWPSATTATLCDRRIDGVTLDAIDATPKRRDAIDARSRGNTKDAASHGAENSGSFCTVKPHNVKFWRSYASANFE